MENEHQRGGAYLRVRSIEKLYQKAGFNVQMVYRNSIKAHTTWKTHLKSLKYGRNVKGLFTEADVTLPEGDILHLDNLRYFNWDLKPAYSKIIYNAHNLENENYFGRTSSLKKTFFKKISFSIQVSISKICIGYKRKNFRLCR